jgi:16S rRNA (cytosine1407-C5)-methyltransferase
MAAAPTPEPATLPALFLERLGRIVPPAALADALAGFARPKPTTLRVNSLQGAPADTRAELQAEGFQLTPLPWLAEGFQVPAEQRGALTRCRALAEGRIYLQNPASLLAALALDPQPGERVLDLAAAPGGKTLHLAALMGNRGQIAAVEAVRERFFKLRANLERGGVQIAKTYLMDGRAVGHKVPGRFDRVLLDPPCSSEARFHLTRPQSWRHWSLRKIREMARKQGGLLASGLRAVKPGGVLLYCTCSFAPEENERVVQALLCRVPGEVRVEPLALPIPNTQPGLTQWAGEDFDPALAGGVRVLPEGGMDALFLCRLRRLG